MKVYYISINEEKEYNFKVIACDDNEALELVNDYIILLSQTTYWKKWNIKVNPAVYYVHDLEAEVISAPVQFYTGELCREKYERESPWKFWKR